MVLTNILVLTTWNSGAQAKGAAFLYNGTASDMANWAGAGIVPDAVK